MSRREELEQMLVAMEYNGLGDDDVVSTEGGRIHVTEEAFAKLGLPITEVDPSGYIHLEARDAHGVRIVACVKGTRANALKYLPEEDK